MTPEEIIRGIDGPEFGKQREVLTQIIDNPEYNIGLSMEDLELLEGLRNFLDAIADCATDNYGIECSYGCSTEEDWQEEVSAGNTRLGYEEWRQHMIESNAE